MTPEAWTAVGVIVAAVAGTGGFLQKYLSTRPPRKRAWEYAIESVERRNVDLESRVNRQDTKIRELHDEVAKALSKNQELETTVERQSKALLAHAARIAQLLQAWPRDSGRPPKPDPAHAPYL